MSSDLFACPVSVTVTPSAYNMTWLQRILVWLGVGAVRWVNHGIFWTIETSQFPMFYHAKPEGECTPVPYRYPQTRWALQVNTDGSFCLNRAKLSLGRSLLKRTLLRPLHSKPFHGSLYRPKTLDLGRFLCHILTDPRDILVCSSGVVVTPFVNSVPLIGRLYV